MSEERMPAIGSALDETVLGRLHRLGGDALVDRMITLFMANVRLRLPAAHAAMRSGTLDDVGRAAHSLKSSAGNVGAIRLQHLAGALEGHASEGHADDASACLAQVDEVCGALMTRLAQAGRGQG
jgi:HPt (histidine-containing phosphotransfer) domain-containing protein